MSKSNTLKQSVEARIVKATADDLKSYTGLDAQTLRVWHRLLKNNLSHKFGRPFDASALMMLVLTLHRLKSGVKLKCIARPECRIAPVRDYSGYRNNPTQTEYSGVSRIA